MALAITEGERAVLDRLGNGLERKEIAKDLGCSVSTVHSRIYEAQRRNSMRTSYQLLAWFVRDSVLASVRAQDGPTDTG